MSILSRSKVRATKRTDEIRKRQAKRARKARKAGSSRKPGKVTPRTMPPVMARSAISSSSVAVKRSPAKKSRIRRKYSVAVGSQGSELRLPALPVIRFDWRVMSLLMTLSLLWILYQFWNSDVYRVESAEIYGLQRLTSADINNVIDISNMQIFLINSQGIQDQLIEYYSEFATVTVETEWPNSVVISVTERLPVLVWNYDGRSNFVDKDGFVFPVREGMSIEGFPVVEAEVVPPETMEFDIESYIPGYSFEEILEEIHHRPPVKVEDPRWRLSPEFVEAILYLAGHAPEKAIMTYDMVHGLGWRDSRGWAVYFGDDKDMDTKLVMYKNILEALKQRDTKPLVISVQFIDAPYVQLSSN